MINLLLVIEVIFNVQIIRFSGFHDYKHKYLDYWIIDTLNMNDECLTKCDEPFNPIQIAII